MPQCNEDGGTVGEPAIVKKSRKTDKRSVRTLMMLVALVVVVGGVITWALGNDEENEQSSRGPGPAASVMAGANAETSPEPKAVAATRRRLVWETRRVLQASLRGLASRSRSDDRTYYENGVWHGGDPACPSCAVAPGMLAAVMARELGSATARRQTIGTFDRMLAELTQPDGSFSPARNGGRGSELPTIKAGIPLAVAYLELRESLPAATRARWREAVHRAATWLEPVLGFYVNGNINMGMTSFMYLASRVTGDTGLRDAFRRSLDFTLDPGDGRWKGYGLRFSKRPRLDDWSDGRGYLAEAGPDGMPGFDPYYLTVQEANAALLYAVSGSPRVGRVLNVLTNTLYARVDKRTWLYPISGGSRRGMGGAVVPLLSPGAATLVLAGKRPELARHAVTQVRRAGVEFGGAVRQGNRQEGVIAAFVAPLVAAHHDRLR